jgi:hypothetical protein
MYILHRSFSDFLVGGEGTGIKAFRVNAAETYAMLCVEMHPEDGKRTQQRYLQYSMP